MTYRACLLRPAGEADEMVSLVGSLVVFYKACLLGPVGEADEMVSLVGSLVAFYKACGNFPLSSEMVLLSEWVYLGGHMVQFAWMSCPLSH